MTFDLRQMFAAFVVFCLTLLCSHPAWALMESKPPIEQAYVNINPDLTGLSERLEDTSAIGFFAKLDLKHRFEKLLEDVDRYHQGQSADLEGLKTRFNDILIRTLRLIENADPALYRELLSAREAIWLALRNGESLNATP